MQAGITRILPTQTDVSVIAHRGAWARHRENTLEAFVEARRLGADGVELDVRASADGALVVHHDAEIPGVGGVARLTVAELPAWVPLVSAALDACAGMTTVLEIKNLPGVVKKPQHEPGIRPNRLLPVVLCRIFRRPKSWADKFSHGRARNVE